MSCSSTIRMHRLGTFCRMHGCMNARRDRPSKHGKVTDSLLQPEVDISGDGSLIEGSPPPSRQQDMRAVLYSRSQIEGYPLGQVSAWWQTAVPKGRLRSALPEHPVQGMWQLSYLACPCAGISRQCSAVSLDQSQAAGPNLQRA